MRPGWSYVDPMERQDCAISAQPRAERPDRLPLAVSEQLIVKDKKMAAGFFLLPSELPGLLFHQMSAGEAMR